MVKNHTLLPNFVTQIEKYFRAEWRNGVAATRSVYSRDWSSCVVLQALACNGNGTPADDNISPSTYGANRRHTVNMGYHFYQQNSGSRELVTAKALKQETETK